MNPEVLERLLITAVIIGLGLLAYTLFNRFTLSRAESKVRQFESYLPGLPAIVYFTTPTCAPCRTVQRPAIRSIVARLGEWFQVIEVDASEHPGIAREWGVVSVPTTFIIDPRGKPRYVNHGVVNAQTLIKQLEIEDYTI
jgi:thiol-disulfide isomerase/thioredoxin